MKISKKLSALFEFMAVCKADQAQAILNLIRKFETPVFRPDCESFMFYLAVASAEELFSGSQSWAESEEGLEFWESLDHDWRIFLKIYLRGH